MGRKGLTRREVLGAGGVALAASMLHAPVALASHDEDGSVFQPTPLPATAFGPLIDQNKGYFVDEIASGLYWVTEGSYIAMFMETRNGVVVVDAPPTLFHALPSAIADVTSKSVTHFIYSHSHGDHVGVAGLLFPDATFIGHEETAATLRRRADTTRRPIPTRTFKNRKTLVFAGRRLELMYPGPQHEPGNIFVWAPEEKTLMWVDAVFPGWVPFKSLALSQDVPGYVAAHDTALALPFETFVGGHLTRLGDREDVEIAKAYIADVRTASGTALANVDFFGVIGDIGFLDQSDPSFLNQWELFNRYLDEVAHFAEQMVLDTWRTVLGGADVFTFSHCLAMVDSIRIDDNAVSNFV